MLTSRWILICDPDEADREILRMAIRQMSASVQVVTVDRIDEVIPMLARQRSMPLCALIEWTSPGGSIASCMDTLERVGLRGKMQVIAMARDSARTALVEAHKLGLQRFISKQPDEDAFAKKVIEAVGEVLPRGPVVPLAV